MEIWGSVYGVSNAGKKKGRAKRKEKAKRKGGTNLNRGQKIGDGLYKFTFNEYHMIFDILISKSTYIKYIYSIHTRVCRT